METFLYGIGALIIVVLFFKHIDIIFGLVFTGAILFGAFTFVRWSGGVVKEKIHGHKVQEESVDTFKIIKRN